MGRRDRSKGSRGGSRGGPQGRVRERVRDLVQGRGRRGREGGPGRKRGGSLDVEALGNYAGRLAGRSGGASALVGAASGLAGGGLASRFPKGAAEGSEEDFRREVLEQLSLIDERLLRLEGEMNELLGAVPGSDTEGLAEPDATTDPESSL
ncbi:MAG: hypothetical protein ACRDTR_05850 [Rubrobacter sp.]